MNLQPTNPERIVGQAEFLRNTVGMEFKTAGGTLDHTAFGDVAENGYIKAGTAVYIGPDGLYLPWDDTAGTADGAGLTAHDVKLVEGSNPIVGILIAGHPLEDKCTGVTEAFKDAVRGFLRFDA